MHVPDGFFDLPMSLLAFVVAIGVLAVAVVKARSTLDDRTAPLAGLTAVFVFAAEMVNFPIAAGTSGHLIGAALAAILVGPWAAMLVMTVVITVQALLFADGGLTALGINLLNLAVVAVIVGWLVFRLGARMARSRTALAVVAGIAGFLSVVASAGAFVIEYAIGGTTAVSLTAVAAAMGGIHALIGVAEGVITGLVVAAVLASRPDIVAGIRGLPGAAPPAELEAVSR